MISINGENKKVSGIIVECNPFHKGHLRLIKECKKNSDIIIAVMSGNFVQRGEPAVYDKCKRAEELIKNGVDIVIELPIEYVMSSAKYFAYAGVNILDKLGFVDFIVFGSKVASIEKLREYVHLMDGDSYNESLYDSINDKLIKENLKKGKSYAAAVGEIYHTKLTSNDILAIEYIRSLKELKSNIIPITIERKEDLPTASFLREKIKKKITSNDFSYILNYKLLHAKNKLESEKKNILDDIYLMNKDLRNAMLKEANKAMTFDERAQSLNTKNRTLANIKRIFFNIIFDIRKEDVIFGKQNIDTTNKKKVKKLEYIHIIDISTKGKQLLKYIKPPILMSYAPKSYKNYVEKYKNYTAVKKNKKGEIILSPILQKNIFASELYYLIKKV